MEVVWQVIVDGNFDNIDMDYSGRFVVFICYNLEKVVDFGGMMCNECDWVVVFDILCIEVEIKVKCFVIFGDLKVLVVDGWCKDGKDSLVICYILVLKNFYGLNILLDGKYFIVNGKFLLICIMIVIECFGDLFVGKLVDLCDVVVGELELGFGLLYIIFDG